MSTFVLIEKYTVGAGGVSSVTLGSGGTIPQTYTDLVVKCSVRGSTGSFPSLRIKANGATTNYSSRRLYGDGTSAASDTPTTPAYWVQAPITSASETANTFANSEYVIPNYTGSNYKSISFDSVAENNATATYTMLVAGLWSSTSAITSLDFFLSSGNLAQYSTFYLYGILKA